MPQVTKSYTGTGTGDPCLIKDGVMRISGTFAGTLQVMVDAIGDGTYAVATDSTGTAISLTTTGTMRVNNGIACNTRVDCTAYTSGTINTALRGN